MQTRPFGKKDLQVSEIGHGTWTMGSMWGPRDDEKALSSLIRSLELGVTFIDTAYVYGDGHSEQLIAKAFKKTGKKVFVATKVPPKNYQWPARHHVPVSETFPAEHIVKFTETSLKNLEMDCVDLQQLHVWSDNWLDQGDWLTAVEKLKRDGKIRFFGVSINDHEPDSALKIVESGLIDSVQVIYNIFEQRPEEKLFPLCQKMGVAVIARVPLDEGSLTGTLTPKTQFPKGDWRKHYFTPERLKETCARVEKIKNLPHTALQFCLSHPAVTTVIPGMRTIAHVEDNCAASGKKLSASELAELKKQAWPRNFYPVY
ncbi:MAG: aldo/keto reductase [Deltaproteobacteria bacterium]|nr:aldo/keto reductase [Deltaproteobacteria bacterium]